MPSLIILQSPTNTMLPVVAADCNVLQGLVHKTNDPNDSSFDMQNILSTVTGGNGGFDIGGLINQFSGGSNQQSGGGILDTVKGLFGS